MRHVLYFLGLSLGVVALGCSSSATTTTVIVRPELVAVSPDDVLGVLPSGDAAQVHSYVATLFDVTADAEGGVPSPGFQLASSPPTSVQLPVTFSFVVTSHRYLAVVDLYTQPTQAEAEAEAAAAPTPVPTPAPTPAPVTSCTLRRRLLAVVCNSTKKERSSRPSPVSPAAGTKPVRVTAAVTVEPARWAKWFPLMPARRVPQKRALPTSRRAY